MWRLLGPMIVTVLTAPSDATSRMQEALAREQVGDDAGAVALLDGLIRDRPELELPRIEAARLRLKRGDDLDGAQFHLEAVRSRSPENPRGQYLWGLLMEERKRPQEAAQGYELAVLYRPDYTEARLRLGALYVSQGDWLHAEAHLRVLAQRNPELVQSRLQLANALERQNRLADCEQVFRQLLADEPTSIPVVRRAAEFYERTDRPEVAARLRKTLEAPAPKKKMRPLKRSKR